MKNNVFKTRGACAIGALLVGSLAAMNFARSEPSGLETESNQPQTPRPTLSPAEQRMRQQAALRGQREQKQREWQAQSDQKSAAARRRLPQVKLGSIKRIASWDSIQNVERMEFSPDGRVLAVGGGPKFLEQGVELRDTKKWNATAFFPGAQVWAWSPNSQLLAIEREGIDIWNVPSKRLVRNLADGTGFFPTQSGKKSGVYGPLLFSEDGRFLVTLGEDPHSKWKLDDGPQTDAAFIREMALKTWDVQTGKRVNVKLGPYSGSDFPRFLVPLSRTKKNFAFWTFPAFGVSKSRPRVYVYSSHLKQERLFETEYRPDENFVEIPLTSEPISVSVAANGWIYAYPDPKEMAISIYQSRDEKLLHQLPLSSGVSALALSLDAQLLAVSLAAYGTKTFADGSSMRTNSSRIEIYELNTKVESGRTLN